MKWNKLEKHLDDIIQEMKNGKAGPVFGQDAAAYALARRLTNNGAILADDVGLGKTRVALMLMEAVARSGGTVAVVAPSGLQTQWCEEASKFTESLKNNGILAAKPNCVKVLNDLVRINYHVPLNHHRSVELQWSLISQGFKLVKNKYVTNDDSGRRDKTNQVRAHLRASVKKIVDNGLSEPCENTRDVVQLIGTLIGGIDFLVVDEAHKSRYLDVEDDDEKDDMQRLPFLLNHILKRKSNSRCLCMTATPVEMGAEQWPSLLDRCGAPKKLLKKVLKDSAEFSSTLKLTTEHPENGYNLEQLLLCAGELHDDLSPYVVRRRRSNQNEYKALIKNFTNQKGAYPHRSISPVSVDMGKLDESWKPIVLCMEGISSAAKDIQSGHRDKLLHCRYAAGMLSTDDSALKDYDSAVKDTEKRDTAKSRRLNYWKEKLLQYEQREAFMLTHPRIQAAADHIDQICEKDEKVLVFGTYTAPMRALRDELNYRHILFRMEKGLSVAIGQSIMDNVNLLWNIYSRLRERKGWKRWSVKRAFKKRFAEERRNTQDASRWLNDHVFKNGFWLDVLEKQETYNSEKGMAFIDSMRNLEPETLSDVVERLRWELLERIYQSKEKITLKGSLSNKQKQILSDLIVSLFDEYVKSDKEDDPSGLEHLSKKRFLRAVTYDKVVGRHDAFCSILDGSISGPKRRQVLIRRFNEGINPQVLIAQSKVGREGLNLHRACKHVVIFNTEWNPAVVEQEIGRVDRIYSLWHNEMNKWNNGDPSSRGDCPKITVDFIVFDETYDRHQFDVFEARRKELSSQLFGTLLEETVMERVPEEYRQKYAEKLATVFDFEPKLSY